VKPQVDSILGYRVIGLLGSGARTTIYHVEDGSGDSFALKHLLVRNRTDHRCLAQMRNEHEIARQLSHPGIRKTRKLRLRRAPFRVVEAGLLMDHVQGLPLDKAKPREIGTTVQCLLDVATALASMHRSGWIHGDVKPTNLIRTDEGTLLIDLGQAARSGIRKERIQGTPGFMAPEQVMRNELTSRTDLFGFGATMYWALTGNPVPTVIEHAGGENQGITGSAVNKPAVATPLHEIRDDVPEELSQLVASCISYNAKNRPSGFAEVLGTLARHAPRSS